MVSVYDGIPYQVKQRAGRRGITAENMEKKLHGKYSLESTDPRESEIRAPPQPYHT